MSRYLVPALIFVVLVAFFWAGLYLNPAEVPSPLIDKPVPEFELARLKDPDQQIGSDVLKGKVSLLNVWATWCVACRQEHDLLLAVAESGQIPIYGLNWKDERDAALRWLDTLGDPYVANAFDQHGRVAIDWGVYGAPETFLVDAKGMIRHKHIGPITTEVWQNRFMPLIRELEGPQ